jgi:hypothetical protein
VVAPGHLVDAAFDREASVLEDANAVAALRGAGARVGDDEAGHAEAVTHLDDQLVDLVADEGVESGIRLVVEHVFGIRDERAREAGPQLHAARNARWKLRRGVDSMSTSPSTSCTRSRSSLLPSRLCSSSGSATLSATVSQLISAAVLEQVAHCACAAS